jgi:hypothetical protein
MPALSYKGRFVDYVEAGLQPKRKKGVRIKRQSVRNFRKVPFKKGDTLYHFYGMRTKFCRRLGTSICKSVHRIIINGRAIYIGMKEITDVEKLNAFAYDDGFANWEEMKRWWKLTHGPKCFPFVGQLIKW